MEWRFARLPRLHGDDYGFPPTFAADLRWALLRYDREAHDATARVRFLPMAELERIADCVLDACPDVSRLEELQCEVQQDDDGIVTLLLDRITVCAPTREDPDLLPLLDRTARTVGTLGPFAVAANAFSHTGQHARARSLLSRMEDEIPALPPNLQILVAEAFALAQSNQRAEEIYRGVLARRWLSGRVRMDAVTGLTNLLASQGRADEANQIAQMEVARQDEMEAGRREPDVKTGPKVGRNDPCPCGSGKKAKKCCGTAA